MTMTSEENELYSAGMGLEMSEAANKFEEDTQGEDELQVILRGHLYIEHEIEKLLRLKLIEPDYILTNRFMFTSKVNLAVALGLLPKNRKKMYEKLNSIRNNYAHQLNFKITEKHLSDLVSCMDEEVKEHYLGYSGGTLIENMRYAISALWIDALLRIYGYKVDEFKKESDQLKELYMMKINPISDEELKKKSEELKRKADALFPE